MKKILISNGHCVRLVAQRHIVFCKSDNCYTSFFLDNGDELVVCQSLKKVQQGLDFNIFIRVSQSYLINKEYILLIDKKQKCWNSLEDIEFLLLKHLISWYQFWKMML